MQLTSPLANIYHSPNKRRLKLAIFLGSADRGADRYGLGLMLHASKLAAK
jgi:hypothetical protein